MNNAWLQVLSDLVTQFIDFAVTFLIGFGVGVIYMRRNSTPQKDGNK